MNSQQRLSCVCWRILVRVQPLPLCSERGAIIALSAGLGHVTLLTPRPSPASPLLLKAAQPIGSHHRLLFTVPVWLDGLILPASDCVFTVFLLSVLYGRMKLVLRLQRLFPKFTFLKLVSDESVPADKTGFEYFFILKCYLVLLLSLLLLLLLLFAFCVHI